MNSTLRSLALKPKTRKEQKNSVIGLLCQLPKFWLLKFLPHPDLVQTLWNSKSLARLWIARQPKSQICKTNYCLLEVLVAWWSSLSSSSQTIIFWTFWNKLLLFTRSPSGLVILLKWESELLLARHKPNFYSSFGQNFAPPPKTVSLIKPLTELSKKVSKNSH